MRKLFNSILVVLLAVTLFSCSAISESPSASYDDSPLITTQGKKVISTEIKLLDNPADDTSVDEPQEDSVDPELLTEPEVTEESTELESSEESQDEITNADEENTEIENNPIDEIPIDLEGNSTDEVSENSEEEIPETTDTVEDEPIIYDTIPEEIIEEIPVITVDTSIEFPEEKFYKFSNSEYEFLLSDNHLITPGDIIYNIVAKDSIIAELYDEWLYDDFYIIELNNELYTISIRYDIEAESWEVKSGYTYFNIIRYPLNSIPRNWVRSSKYLNAFRKVNNKIENLVREEY